MSKVDPRIVEVKHVATMLGLIFIQFLWQKEDEKDYIVKNFYVLDLRE